MSWNQKLLLMCITAASFLVFSGRLIVPTLFTHVEENLGVSHAEIGLGMTFLWLFYGLMQFPSGIFSDEKGRKTVVIFAVFIFSIAFFAVSIASNYLFLLLALAMLGIGFGSFYSVGMSILSDQFSKNKGTVLGIQSAMGSLAGIIPLVLPIFVNDFGWRVPLLICSAASLLILYLFTRFVHVKEQKPQSKRQSLEDGITIIKDRKVWPLIAINTLVSFCWIGLISFLPIYLITSKQLAANHAGIIFSMIFLTGLILKPLAGYLSDRYNHHLLITVVLLTAGSSFYLLTELNSVAGLFLIATLLASLSAFFPLRSSYLMKRWPNQGRGSRMGFYQSIVLLIGSAAPAVIGYAGLYTDYTTIFLLLSTLLLMSGVALTAVKFYDSFPKWPLSDLKKARRVCVSYLPVFKK